MERILLDDLIGPEQERRGIARVSALAVFLLITSPRLVLLQSGSID
jgi:hypothetical protein